jgi:hypothetical protein
MGSKYTPKAIRAALDMHVQAGLIARWRRAGEGYEISRPAVMGAGDQMYPGGTFTCETDREAHVFIQALACAARAVDNGTARPSVMSEVSRRVRGLPPWPAALRED